MQRRFAFAVLASFAAASGYAQLSGNVIASGLSSPLSTIADPGLNGGFMVVQKGGTIRASSGSTYLNLSGIPTDGERGLLGLAFAPNYQVGGDAYVSYTNSSGDLQISRFSESPWARALDTSTEVKLLTIPHPNFNNHYGGTIRFGPDGMLYIGVGDGGSGYDPNGNAQNGQSLLGKMLRIDPTRDDFANDPNRNYGIPTNNPFAGDDALQARDEIWAFGVRNPWKFHFDDPNRGGTGDLIIGDVGQDSWEEINYEFAGSGGHNYGWLPFEGNHATNRGTLTFADTKPIFEYDHSAGQSITGGFIYRGSLLPASMKGRYFFGDFVKGKIWSVSLSSSGGVVSASDLQDHTSAFAGIGGPGSIASIDPDGQGEILITDYSGRVIRVVPEPATVLVFGAALLPFLRRRRR